jgi:coproporphyrinogen III oxidase
MQHRGERRGLGGIFFDDLNDRDGEKLLAFSTGTIFLQSQFQM